MKNISHRFVEYRRLFSLAIPVMTGFLAFHVLGIIDVVMVGRLGPEALAAVGLANTLFFFVLAPVEGFLGATLILLPAMVARKSEKEIAQASSTLTIVSGVVGVLFLFLYPLLSFYLGTMSSDPVVLRMARSYLFIRLGGAIFSTMGIVWWRIFLAFEKNFLIAVFSYLVVGINILGNWLFIFGPGPFPALGVGGAAGATVFAQGVNVGLFLIFGRRFIHSSLKKSWFSWSFLKEFAHIGWPMGATYLIEILAWTVFVSIIARLGTAAVATHEIALKIKDLSLLLGIALASVITQQVSFFIGQQNPGEARRVTRQGVQINMIMMGIIGVIYWFFPEDLVRLVSQDETLIVSGSRLLRFMALYQIVDGLFIAYRAGLEGLGKTKLIRNISLVIDYLLWLPLAWLGTFVFKWGVIGAWFGLTVTVAVLSAIFYRLFSQEVHRAKPLEHHVVSTADEEIR
ncbi:MATE family efflux transporter [Thermospira aquatica]|uniref:Multidrug-efflux transporter n=1 Tax=Thermospira aquatica TaxID=2828656 RepID=A0AAX3BDE0_9SPIR|nr:MATE family efflux transporter [Thermospira aquatica]URA10272.1 MATE family efflux transporter [Thermospira aquatica]